MPWTRRTLRNARPQPASLRSPSPSLDGLFVQPELISHRIRERRERTHSGPDRRPRSQHPSPRRLDLLQGIRDPVDHDVDARALVGRPIRLLHPGATDAARVVEGEVAVSPGPRLPPENARVKLRG